MQSVLQFLQQNMHLLVVVFLVGSSAVGGLIRFFKEQAAKSEQRRRTERTRQEMLRTGQIEASPTATGTSLPPQPLESVGAKAEPEAVLDARRREQLEELRARARQRAGAKVSVPPPAAPAPRTNPLEVLLGLPPGSLTPQTNAPAGSSQGRASSERGNSGRGSSAPSVPARSGGQAGGQGQKSKKKVKSTAAARDEAEARERRQRALVASAAASQAVGNVVGGVVSAAWAQSDAGSHSQGTPAQGGGVTPKPRSPRGKLLSRERGELRRAFLLTQVFGPPHALRE